MENAEKLRDIRRYKELPIHVSFCHTWNTQTDRQIEQSCNPINYALQRRRAAKISEQKHTKN